MVALSLGQLVHCSVVLYSIPERRTCQQLEVVQTLRIMQKFGIARTAKVVEVLEVVEEGLISEYALLREGCMTNRQYDVDDR